MTPNGLDQLKLDEGCRLHAYPDPRSGGDPWTIGYGCTGAGIARGVVWTMAQAEAELAKRVQQVEAQLQHALPWFAAFQHAELARADVLVNMAYNLGVGGLMQFDRFLAAMKAGQWSGAVAAMRLSAWAGEVGDRARRLEAVVLAAPGPAQVSAKTAQVSPSSSRTVEVDL